MEVAPIFAVSCLATPFVPIEKLAVKEPAGIEIEVGTFASGLVDERNTVAPELPAAGEIDTVPPLALPPTTL